MNPQHNGRGKQLLNFPGFLFFFFFFAIADPVLEILQTAGKWEQPHRKPFHVESLTSCRDEGAGGFHYDGGFGGGGGGPMHGGPGSHGGGAGWGPNPGSDMPPPQQGFTGGPGPRG